MRRTIVILITAALTTACASIVSKSDYPVSVNTNPDGARFTISNRIGNTIATGTKPEVVTLEAGSGYFKKQSYEIVFSKDGYEDKVYTLYPQMDGWYWGNILIGGLIGMLIVDPLTGAMYKLPDRVDIAMDAQAAGNQEKVDILFASIDSLSEEQRSRLVPIN